MKVPGRAKPAWASSAAIRSPGRALGWAWFHATHRLRSAGLASFHSIFLWNDAAGRPDEGGRTGVAGYIARWRPSSVSPQAAAFARDVIAAVAPAGPGAGEEPAVGGGQARRLRDRAGPGPGAGRGAAPVGGRAVHPVRAGPVRGGAPDAAHQPAVHRPPGGAAAVSAGRAAAAGAGQAALQPGGDRRVPRPGGRAAHRGAADAGGRAGLPGRRRRADPRRPARRPRHRRDLPLRRGDRRRARRPAPGGAGAVPLPRPAAGRGGVRRDRAGLRRDRSRPPEHHHPADPVAVRRGRAAPAGHLPAARDLAGRCRRAARAWPRSCTPPGSPAPSGSATCSPAWNPPPRPTRSGCSGRPGAP